MGRLRAIWTWLRRRRPQDETASPIAGEEAPTVALAVLAPLGRRVEPAEEDAGFPGFRASALDRLASRAPGLGEARLALNDVFTPAQPVTERRRLAGRLEVLVRLISALEDQRAHVVLYGERGIGKTSLVHVLAGIARESRYHVTYASCGAGSVFEDIFRGVMREVPIIYAASFDPSVTPGAGGATLADLLPQDSFDARQLGDVCAMVTGTRVLIILDEYDRTEDENFRRHVAELIKNLSDRAARVQLVIAGVAGNLQELVGYIPSIRRNIIGLPVPRLDRAEVEALIAIGEREAGIAFAPQAIEAVDQLCHGSPYLARLICHHAGLRAINAERLDVGLEDVALGLDEIVQEAMNRLGPEARTHVPDLLIEGQEKLIGAIALAAASPDGSFHLRDVQSALADPLPDQNIMAELQRLEGLGVILSTGTQDATRHRFTDDTMPFFIWMAVAAQSLPGPSKKRARAAA